jgi:uncharacterized membrane protein
VAQGRQDGGQIQWDTGAVRFVLHSILHAWVSNRYWMAWNLILAVVPAVLAHRLFRPGRRPGVGWWAGLGVFGLFLPNAPYVISDLIHLPGQVATAPTRSAVLLGFLPSYTLYILVGVTSYAYCLHCLRRWLGARSFDPGWVGLEIGIHLTAAVGVLIGRVARLNSWDAVVRPKTTLWTSLTTVSRPASVVYVMVFAGLLFVGCRVLSAIGWTARALAAGWYRPGHLA